MIEGDKHGSGRTATNLGLLLIDDFALMSYASVIEAFRAANSLSGRDLYRWVHVSRDGVPVSASNGATILAERRVGDPIDCDILFVFAAGDPDSFDDGPTFSWLRKLAANGTVLAGVSGGPYVIARAGLLEGFRATIHWEHEAAFRARFPRIELETSLFVIDRRRVTCAGGTAGLDLATELIGRAHGFDLARRVGEWFIQPAARQADLPQRQGIRERYRITNEPVLRALAAMENAIEEALPRSALTRIAGVSLRQLERLFVRHVGASVTATYLELRLATAAQLLRSTSMAITVIAITSGFRSASHLSRTFKLRFGSSPSDWRRMAKRG